MKRKINKLTKRYLSKLAKRDRNKKDVEWRKLVKIRDNNKCCICNNAKFVHIHHILPRENKMLRHDVSNGVALCPLHHKYSLEISAHRNSFAFYIWLMNNKRVQYEYLKGYLIELQRIIELQLEDKSIIK